MMERAEVSRYCMTYFKIESLNIGWLKLIDECGECSLLPEGLRHAKTVVEVPNLFRWLPVIIVLCFIVIPFLRLLDVVVVWTDFEAYLCQFLKLLKWESRPPLRRHAFSATKTNLVGCEKIKLISGTLAYPWFYLGFRLEKLNSGACVTDVDPELRRGLRNEPRNLCS